MLAEILAYVGLLLPGLMLFWLIFIVVGQFQRAGLRLTPFEAGALLVPLMMFLVSFWRVKEAQGISLVRFEAALTLFLLCSILAMAPTKWCEALVMSVRDLRQDKVTKRATVVIVIVTVSAMFFLVELGGVFSVLIDIGQARWEEVPKSKQFFMYGLGIAVIAALSVVGMGGLFKEKPEQGTAPISVVFQFLCLFWALCWILSIFHALLEKIGTMK